MPCVAYSSLLLYDIRNYGPNVLYFVTQLSVIVTLIKDWLVVERVGPRSCRMVQFSVLGMKKTILLSVTIRSGLKFLSHVGHHLSSCG